MTEHHVTIESGWNLDNSYAGLPKSLYSSTKPTAVRAPKLIVFNEELALSLGLNVAALTSEEGVAVLAGNQLAVGSLPLAQAYAGHQFGHFTRLGDGRAVLLGEQLTPEGERFDIQLKGSGRTPYSRGGDGRASLGPMLREYIISEAMHALGIPTTRSLSVVATGEDVYRETAQPGAILTRVAASHIRVGTFEYVANWGTKEDLRALADYTLQRHAPKVDHGSTNSYLILLKEVIKRQASLIAKWQLVGFIHGVMNTDNMALSGESIDFGPCAFMNDYDQATVFSSIDAHGRYAYGNQPNIGAWNLARFAETLLPLLHDKQEQAVLLAQEAIAEYTTLFHGYWLTGMRAKLGLLSEEPEDEALITSLLGMMKEHQADFTNTFLALTFDRPSQTPLEGSAEFTQWKELWKKRRDRQQESRELSIELMRNRNPAIIPRNHRVEEALLAAVDQGDLGPMERLLKALSTPYEHSSEQAEYATPPEPSDCKYQTFCGT